MTTTLTGRHIIVGITGSIAAYKAASLVRLLVKSGAEVQIIMTPSAVEFIAPLTLSTLSGRPVIKEFFSANDGRWNSHVDLGLWADALVVAPATASTIGKMANGIADNMLVTTYLSAKAPVFVAPAMDLDMMKHPTTTSNLEKLKSFGNYVIEPASGELASHLIGKGRMEEPENIVKYLEEFFRKGESMTGKKVVITAGPTYEKLDPVRFIGNYSSGKMGYALAEEAARRGAEVTLVSGPVSLKATHPRIKTVKVESAREMLEAVEGAFEGSDIAIMAAAVADYRPKTVSPNKMKHYGTEEAVIELTENPDIAATLGRKKRPGQKLVGFALETNNEMENAVEKMQRKNFDMIVLNSLKDEGAGFQCDTNRVTLLFPDGRRESYPVKPKSEVASDILDAINQ